MMGWFAEEYSELLGEVVNLVIEDKNTAFYFEE